MDRAEQYRSLSSLIQGEPLPAAIVDLDAFDANVDRLLAVVRSSHKTLRIASKSLRSVDLLRRVFERAGDAVRGVLCYAPAELRFLVERGFDDLLLAYPTAVPEEIDLLASLQRGGATVRTVVDDPMQVERLGEAARREQTEIPVLIDLDVGWRPIPGVHVGVRRSPVRTENQALALAERIRATGGVRLDGLMAYEAQIAGLPDAGRHRAALNPVKAAIRRLSRAPVAKARERVRDALVDAGFDLKVVNGGGTGSLSWAAKEQALTELSAGSGILCSHLFDGYRGLDLRPALFFALPIARRPDPRIITCRGGGYVASGEAGPDRLPLPWLPEGLSLLSLEGAGEVQTPLLVPRGMDLGLGAPVFFRPAKSGEIGEHFTEYVLGRGDVVEGRARTYRGEGMRFG